MDREDENSSAARRAPFAGDSLGLAVERLFQASFELHGALALVAHPVAHRRARRAIELMDEAVRAIRQGALEQGSEVGGRAEGVRDELGELIEFQRAVGALAARRGLSVEAATARMAEYAYEQGLRSAVVAGLVLEGAEGVIAAIAGHDPPEA